jgi:hypothetical protein
LLSKKRVDIVEGVDDDFVQDGWLLKMKGLIFMRGLIIWHKAVWLLKIMSLSWQ